jgi:transcription initiation factor TFIIIB Brf1 subunit/transcription initiation factor TFIIB
MTSVVDDEDRPCRACQSTSLWTDWAQGDRVCTKCGVVDEARLLDDRPEWRDFNEADDLAKGAASMSRSGLVPTDESKYVGGLEPTRLSQHVYGARAMGGNKTSKLIAAFWKQEKILEKRHKKELQAAKLSLSLKRKMEQVGEAYECANEEGESDVYPEYEQLVRQEESELQMRQSALYADKWSLDRALRLYTPHSSDVRGKDAENDEGVDALDATLKKASLELYRAHCILESTARALKLESNVMNEATHLLCRYSIHNDGLSVKGLQGCKPVGKMQKKTRELQSIQQYGALCAAVIVLTTRHVGCPRTIGEVCESMVLPVDEHMPVVEMSVSKKNCNRAMQVLKDLFEDIKASSLTSILPAAPVAGKAASRDGAAVTRSTLQIGQLVDHHLRKLELPPVAVGSVQVLMMHWVNREASCNLPLVCSALAYLVAQTGAAMQRLAAQSFEGQSGGSADRYARPSKRRRVGESNNKKNATSVATTEQKDLEQEGSVSPNSTVEDVLEKDVDEIKREQRAYEMRRVWDAWQEQTPWQRSLADIERECGLSRSKVSVFYDEQVYPHRVLLLQTLKDACTEQADSTDEAVGLQRTPLANVLLPHISIAADLLMADHD